MPCVACSCAGVQPARYLLWAGRGGTLQACSCPCILQRERAGAGTAGACSPRAGPEADWLVGSSGFEGEAASGVVLLPTTPAPAAAAPGAGLAASWLPELLLGFGAGP